MTSDRSARGQPAVDPDPFTIAVGIAGIIGGMASAVGLYQSLMPNQPLRVRKKLLTTLGEADDLLRYLDTDIEILSDLLRGAQMSDQRRFRLGSRAALDHHPERPEELT